MKPRSLVDAAIEDQERRLIAASPREFVRPSLGKVHCAGGCGRMTWRSQAAADGVYRCKPCRAVWIKGEEPAREPEMQHQGWTASRSPCGPDDVDAR
jgi:hypothetical protein